MIEKIVGWCASIIVGKEYADGVVKDKVEDPVYYEYVSVYPSKKLQESIENAEYKRIKRSK